MDKDAKVFDAMKATFVGGISAEQWATKVMNILGGIKAYEEYGDIFRHLHETFEMET